MARCRASALPICGLALKPPDARHLAPSRRWPRNLTVSEGAGTVNMALLGSYLAGSFVASSDGHGGTLVTDPPARQSLLSQPHA
jgi:hypothetical protein